MRGGIDPMTTDNGFQPDRPPIFLSGHAEETAPPEIEQRLGRGGDIVANLQGECVGGSRDDDRRRRSIVWKSGPARRERDGLVERQACAPARSRYIGIDHSNDSPARRRQLMCRRARRLLRLPHRPIKNTGRGRSAPGRTGSGAGRHQYVDAKSSPVGNGKHRRRSSWRAASSSFRAVFGERRPVR